jgi:hypothetical protein
MRQREWVNAEWSGFTATGGSAPGVAGDELPAFAAIMPESRGYLTMAE